MTRCTNCVQTSWNFQQNISKPWSNETFYKRQNILVFYLNMSLCELNKYKGSRIRNLRMLVSLNTNVTMILFSYLITKAMWVSIVHESRFFFRQLIIHFWLFLLVKSFFVMPLFSACQPVLWQKRNKTFDACEICIKTWPTAKPFQLIVMDWENILLHL